MFLYIVIGLSAAVVVLLLFPSVRRPTLFGRPRGPASGSGAGDEPDPIVAEDARSAAGQGGDQGRLKSVSAKPRGRPEARRGSRRHGSAGRGSAGRGEHKDVPAAAVAGGPAGKTKKCPVCGTLLAPGERIKSVVYKGGAQQHGTITELATEIYGCPHCYPANSGHPRICPVCGGEVNSDGYLIARMLERKGRKPHVRVLGCTACRENRKLR